jgi:dTMP kinase
MFFSFDGLDGVGKSTQMTLFEGWLAEQGFDVVRCVDPGSTPLGDAVRDILLGGRLPIARTAEMLLFMAARAQLVDEVIRPALEQGKVVVSDRYVLANVVYQGFAGGLGVDVVRQIGLVATQGIMPDQVFLLDMAPAAAAGRMSRQLDRMESQGDDFNLRLREGFLAEAAKDPARIKWIDAARSVDDVQADIRRVATPLVSGQAGTSPR